VIALLLCAACLWLARPEWVSAEPVGTEQVYSVVAGWLGLNHQPLGATVGQQIAQVQSFSDAAGNVLYYIVHLEPSGFVIVPADDSAEPILGFGQGDLKGLLQHSPLPDFIGKDVQARVAQSQAVTTATDQSVELLSTTAEQAELQQLVSRAQNKWRTLSAYGGATLTIMGAPAIADVRVGPFVKSTWGQTTVGDYLDGISCYNYYTPPYESGNPDNYPCGCIATAMSQLMRYYEHPARYMWSNMPLTPDEAITLVQRQTIGRLCRDAGDAAGTSYAATSSGGSSATLVGGSLAMKSSFGYSNSIYARAPAIGETLNNMVNPNLDAGYPVLLGLDGPSGGHSVLCDGYGYNTSTLYHHLNMGWSGRDNLWYALPTVEALFSFNAVQACVYNTYTSGTGEIVSGRVIDIAGNPIAGAKITGQLAGGGTYYTTTDAMGIYALPKLPSNRTVTATAEKSPHSFISRTTTIGRSLDYAGASGNKWGVNFISSSTAPPTAYSDTIQVTSGATTAILLRAGDDGLPNPPGRLTYTILSLPRHGRLMDPAAGAIAAVPYAMADFGNTVDYRSCSSFAGRDSFEFKAGDGGAAPQAGDSQPATITIDVNNVAYVTIATSDSSIAAWPMQSSYHDSRTQVIYLAGEIGGAGTITALTLDVHQPPGQTLNNWTIRMKHTQRSMYDSVAFETTGWTTVYQASETVGTAGPRQFEFQTPFEYNGIDNLLIDFSHNNDSASTDGQCKVSPTDATRVLMAFSNSAHGDPLSWTSRTFSQAYVSEAVPNIRLRSVISSEALAGDLDQDCDVDIDDFVIFASAWLSSPADADWPTLGRACDISAPADGVINLADFAVLADNWLQTN